MAGTMPLDEVVPRVAARYACRLVERDLLDQLELVPAAQADPRRLTHVK